MNVDELLGIKNKILGETLQAEDIERAYEFLNRCSDEALKILGEKEKRVATIMAVVKAFSLTYLVTNGGGAHLVMANAAGELDKYTDAVVLMTIGLLAEDEII